MKPNFFGLNKITAVGNIDTSGISMLDEVKKIIDRRGLKVHFYKISFNFFHSIFFFFALLSLLVSFDIFIARIGEPGERGDEEDEQIGIDGENRSRMDFSDCWRGCWSLQLHASHHETRPGKRRTGDME